MFEDMWFRKNLRIGLITCWLSFALLFYFCGRSFQFSCFFSLGVGIIVSGVIVFIDPESEKLKIPFKKK